MIQMMDDRNFVVVEVANLFISNYSKMNEGPDPHRSIGCWYTFCDTSSQPVMIYRTIRH